MVPKGPCVCLRPHIRRGAFSKNPQSTTHRSPHPPHIQLHRATLRLAGGTRYMVHTLASRRNPGRSPLPTLGTYGAVSPSSLPRRRRAHTGVEHPEIHKLVDRGPNQPMELLVERAACPPLPLRSLGPSDPIGRFIDRRNRPSKVLDN